MRIIGGQEVILLLYLLFIIGLLYIVYKIFRYLSEREKKKNDLYY